MRNIVRKVLADGNAPSGPPPYTILDVETPRFSVSNIVTF